MRRAQRRLLWLLTGVAALLALAFWQWHAGRATATLLALDPTAINRIDIHWQGQPAEHYLKRDGHWYRAGQRVADAYPSTLAALAATPVLNWRRAADMAPGKLGLSTPAVRLRLNGHDLIYGALAAFGPQRFVRVGNRIAIIPARYSPRPAAGSTPPAAASSSQKS